MAQLSQTNLINDPNLLSYYKFESNSNDELGNRNGIDTNVLYIPAKYQQGASFVGNGNINTGTHVYTNAQVATGSLAFWFKRNGIPSGIEDLFDDSGWWGARIDSSGHVGGFSDGSGNNNNDGNNYCDNILHHFVMTWDATHTNIYIGGVLVKSVIPSGSPTPDSSPTRQARIGSLWDGVTNPFIGLIDDLVTFNRMLSVSEIKDLASEFLPGLQGVRLISQPILPPFDINHYCFPSDTSTYGNLIVIPPPGYDAWVKQTISQPYIIPYNPIIYGVPPVSIATYFKNIGWYKVAKLTDIWTKIIKPKIISG